MSIQVKASQGPLGHVLAVYFFPSLRVDYDDAPIAWSREARVFGGRPQCLDPPVPILGESSV